MMSVGGGRSSGSSSYYLCCPVFDLVIVRFGVECLGVCCPDPLYFSFSNYVLFSSTSEMEVRIMR